jgi:hypothetical protein
MSPPSIRTGFRPDARLFKTAAQDQFSTTSVGTPCTSGNGEWGVDSPDAKRRLLLVTRHIRFGRIARSLVGAQSHAASIY